MANVLIIDDDVEMCRMLSDLVNTLKHEAAYTNTIKEGLELAVSGRFDVVFLDVKMPDGNGLEILEHIRDIHFPPEVIIITGDGDSDGVEIAIKNGAWDYLQKPLSPKKIMLPLNRVLQYRDGIKPNRRVQVPLEREGIIGESPKLRACLTTMAQAANTDVNVLITGETGTGKELFARAIHRYSSRSSKKFVVVDCAAMPETLIESALFGHEKGAFTGADRSSEGLIGQAHGGTLFLDEVAELSQGLQKAFLRVLQERRYRPIGGNREIDSDFRLVAATNRNPEKIVKRGLFRKDLLYRLRAISIELPSLSERMEDVNDLVEYLTSKIYKKLAMEPKGYSPDFINSLYKHDWPGNVRELANTLEAAISAAYYEPILFPKHLPGHIRIEMTKLTVPPLEVPISEVPGRSAALAPAATQSSFRAYRDSVLSDAERSYLKDLMMATRGNIKNSCKISGLGRTRLYTMMKKHGIDRMGWEE
jgi:two-component system, NtrC family, response regulator